jgi:hypothetical protein
MGRRAGESSLTKGMPWQINLSNTQIVESRTQLGMRLWSRAHTSSIARTELLRLATNYTRRGDYLNRRV